MKKITKFFKWLGSDLAEIGKTFVHGNIATKISFLIMGFGSIVRKQFLRGFALLAVEVLYIWYMASFGAEYVAKITTLGTVESGWNADYTAMVQGENSFLILLFGLLGILFTLVLIYMWRVNIRQQYRAEQLLKAGKKLKTNKQDFASIFDEYFDKTLLALPMLGIAVFTALPIIFMICIAFTNYDVTHQSPQKLFTWVGFENFKELLSFSSGLGSTFGKVLGWTLIWAFFATFLNYFLGMGLAMLINKKGIILKKMWRTIFVVTIAVPQFVSLLYVGKLFAVDGYINLFLIKHHIIETALPFWTNGTWAKFTILGINLWIGIPYLMLIATGLLMNIPEDLYESARIDGANKFQMFRKITLPYMLFVTGPYLLTSFIGNLNNFNVIFLLSKGGPKSDKLTGGAGKTDLLITWLYKMTVEGSNYKLAATIGIMVFMVTAIISLVVYRMLPSIKDEEGFQ